MSEKITTFAVGKLKTKKNCPCYHNKGRQTSNSNSNQLTTTYNFKSSDFSLQSCHVRAIVNLLEKV